MGSYVTYSATDVGTVKEINQDRVGIAVNTHPALDAAMGILCDGVGGLQDGEYASASTYNRFMEWFCYELPQLVTEDDFEGVLQGRWYKLLENQNKYLYRYAKARQVRLGTTLTVLLLYGGRYYALQVGDSRAYQITDRLGQLTEDQSLVAREVRLGHITKEEAKFDSRRNILLQSVGYAPHVDAEFYTGALVQGASYLLCSDGFYHYIEEEEFIRRFYELDMSDIRNMKQSTDEMMTLVKERGEKDNISAAVIYVAQVAAGQKFITVDMPAQEIGSTTVGLEDIQAEMNRRVR